VHVYGAAFGAGGGLPDGCVKFVLGYDGAGAGRQVGEHVELLGGEFQGVAVEAGPAGSEAYLEVAHGEGVAGFGRAAAQERRYAGRELWA
jgi:hypothetical protein